MDTSSQGNSESNSELQPILVSKRQAARLLDLCTRTVEQLISRGELRAKRIGKRVLLLREDLEKFARS
jgi:excisionase family DNA binding protein